MEEIPVLFFRNGDGDVLMFMPLNQEVMNRLRILAVDHSFEVARLPNDVLVISQGDAWEKAPKNFTKPVRQRSPYEYRQVLVQERTAVMIGGGSVSEACLACARTDCGGFENTSPEITNKGAVKNAVDAMREAVMRPESCPLYVHGLEVSTGSIQRRHLTSLGFAPSSSVQAFTVNNLDPGDHDTLASLKDPSDYDAVVAEAGNVFVQDLLTKGWGNTEGRWGRRIRASTFSDLDFDPNIIAANQLAARVRGGYAGKKKKLYSDFRIRECAKCVYSCPKPPWNTDSPCSLTMESILSENVPTRDNLTWMALHTITGERFISGRSKFIGWRPKQVGGEWGMEIRNLRPPYNKDTMSVHDYWSKARGDSRYMHDTPRLDDGLDQEILTVTNWALRSLSDLTHRGEARFDVNGGSHRNDILYMTLESDCRRIEIGSDTRASSGGGRFMQSGPAIKTDSRPRFHTGYAYPFFEGIFHWFGRTPGARGGRSK